jgi:uncharacterized repeat protein (TIGR01451 family)
MMNNKLQRIKLLAIIGLVTIVSIAGIGLLTSEQTLSASETAKNETCEDQGKVAICHIPPGNPDNPQTICVAEEAVPAHLEHGDSLGACVEPTPTPGPTVTPTPTRRQVRVIAPPNQTGQFGDTLHYTFEVINRGNVDDHYRVTLTSEHQFPTGPIPAEIQLYPGENRDIAITVEIPLSGDFSSDRLTLEVVSLSDPSIRDADSVTTYLEAPQPSVTFTKTVDKPILAPGELVEYTLRYRNTGNIPLLEITIEDRLPEQLRFEASTIPVDIIDESTLRFTLEPVFYQNQREDFTFTARVKDDKSSR